MGRKFPGRSMLYKNHYMLAYLQKYHFFLYRTNQFKTQKQFETQVCGKKKENNTKPQTISLVSKVSKLFRKLISWAL